MSAQEAMDGDVSDCILLDEWSRQCLHLPLDVKVVAGCALCGSIALNVLLFTSLGTSSYCARSRTEALLCLFELLPSASEPLLMRLNCGPSESTRPGASLITGGLVLKLLQERFEVV